MKKNIGGERFSYGRLQRIMEGEGRSLVRARRTEPKKDWLSCHTAPNEKA